MQVQLKKGVIVDMVAKDDGLSIINLSSQRSKSVVINTKYERLEVLVGERLTKGNSVGINYPERASSNFADITIAEISVPYYLSHGVLMNQIGSEKIVKQVLRDTACLTLIRNSGLPFKMKME